MSNSPLVVYTKLSPNHSGKTQLIPARGRKPTVLPMLTQII